MVNYDKTSTSLFISLTKYYSFLHSPSYYDQSLANTIFRQLNVIFS